MVLFIEGMLQVLQEILTCHCEFDHTHACTHDMRAGQRSVVLSDCCRVPGGEMSSGGPGVGTRRQHYDARTHGLARSDQSCSGRRSANIVQDTYKKLN